jgi:hypothetical protein
MRVLRGIFGLKRNGLIGGRRKLRNEELRDTDASLSLIIMKSRTIRWAGHVECMDRTAYRRPLRIF